MAADCGRAENNGMAEFEVNSQTITSVSALTKITGEMDSDNFDVLEDEFNKLLESGVLGLVLDLSGVDALSSAGIGAIINMSRLLEARKGRLVVAAMRPKLVGLIEMLGLGEALTIMDTADQARKTIASIKG